jgi:uncharacterized protein
MAPYPVIDSDGHVYEPATLWVDRMPDELKEKAPRPVADRPSLVIDGVEVPPRRLYPTDELLRAIPEAQRHQTAQQKSFSAESQVAGMDTEGIAASVLFPSRGLAIMGVDGVDPAITTAAATVYNDWLAEFCSHAPTRLFGAGMIDPRDVAGAMQEARRCAEMGFVTVFLRPNPVYGRNWDHPDYEPLWTELEALQLPISFHEGAGVLLPQVGTDRFTDHAFWHVCTHPMEQQIAMLSLLLGGVAERHPGLNFAFLECGAGWLPYWMWRMDEAVENEAWKFPDLTLTPSEYVERQCFVSIDTDEAPGLAAIEVLKTPHVVWGSDYPHPDGKYPNAVKGITELLGSQSGYAERVLYEGALALYGDRLGGVIAV